MTCETLLVTIKGEKPMSQQLYAKIKKSSKYYNQNNWAKENGEFPFPVEIHGHALGYCVHGNGNQYRLRDVSLFVIEDGTEIKLS
jgi:hypothetical protein